MKIAVTGGAGFIGSHLVDALIAQKHEVHVFDDLSNPAIKEMADGHVIFPDAVHFQKVDVNNITDFKPFATSGLISQSVHHCDLISRDISGFDIVYHLAALGSVEKNSKYILYGHYANVDGFFNILNLVKKHNIPRFVYATSSSVYGDLETIRCCENRIGKPKSVYAATKLINEIYAESFYANFCVDSIGLRFFNVYGPRQRSDHPYAAVIPKWISAMLENRDIEIYGNGEQRRDFTYVSDVVKALLLAGEKKREEHGALIFNVGTGKETTINQLFGILSELLDYRKKPIYREPRMGDKLHSVASIRSISDQLNYQPSYDLITGLKETIKHMKLSMN